MLNVKDFGAVGDGSTDDSDAIQRAIEATGHPFGGSLVYFPYGRYKVAKTVHVDRAAILMGSGGSLDYPATIIEAPEGVTAIKLHGPRPEYENGDGARDAIVRDLQVRASGRKQTVVSGTYLGSTPPVWTANHPYSLGAIVVPTTQNGYFYKATAADGPTGTSEPDWSQAAVTDGGVTWTRQVFISPPAWAPSTAKARNDVVTPTPQNGYFYRVTAVAGSARTGGSQPKWSAAVLQPDKQTWLVQDNEITWQRMSKPADFAVALDATGDFQNGQVIKIAGAAMKGALHHVTADTSAGSRTITLHVPSKGSNGIYLGMRLFIDTAYDPLSNPIPYAIVEQVAEQTDPTMLTVTMSMEASATVIEKPVMYAEDLFAEIRTGAGTGVLIIDNLNNDGTVSLGAKIEHADCGLLMRCRSRIENVTIQGFQGNGITIQASHGNLPLSNANAFSISNVHCYDNFNGIHVSGEDANGGSGQACRADWNQRSDRSHSYAIADLSLLGNSWIGCACSGGYGYKTLGGFREGVPNLYANEIPGPSNRSVFIGCYTEGGTYNCFGSTATVLGGTMGYHAGGHSIIDGVANRLSIGANKGAQKFSDYFLQFFPNNFTDNLLLFSHTSGGEQKLRKTGPGDGVGGWWGVATEDAPQGFGFLWSDTDASVGRGHFWLPRGYHIGEVSNGTLGNSRHHSIGDAPATTGSQGDLVFDRSPVESGTAGSKYVRIGWVCTVSGDPAVWLDMRVLTGN